MLTMTELAAGHTAGSTWFGFAVGAFAVLIVALLAVIVVGRLRARRAVPLTADDGHHAPPPHPRSEAIPPGGSR